MNYHSNYIFKNIGKYCIKKQIGFGSTSKIFLANDKKGNSFSIKMYVTEKYKSQFENEVNILKTINGAHFPKILETIQYKKCNFIIFPYYSQKDLFDTVTPKLPITNSEIMENIGKMAKPIHDLHQYNIAHLDIKMENYLINQKNGKLLLIDYGTASKIDTFSPSFLIRGTKQYLSPEVLQNNPVLKSDVWSLGIIAMLLNLQEKININNYHIDTQKYLDKIDDSDYLIKHFLRDTLVVDYKKRISIEDLYQKYFE